MGACLHGTWSRGFKSESGRKGVHWEFNGVLMWFNMKNLDLIWFNVMGFIMGFIMGFEINNLFSGLIWTWVHRMWRLGDLHFVQVLQKRTAGLEATLYYLMVSCSST
jgi:hypothetical protein